MCITGAIIGGLLGLAGTVYSADRQRKAAHEAQDAQATAQAKVDTDAAQSANARLAQRRRALASQSLVTDQSASGMASTGRATLGGG